MRHTDDGTARSSKEYTEALARLRELQAERALVEDDEDDYWVKGDPAKFAIAKADRERRNRPKG